MNPLSRHAQVAELLGPLTGIADAAAWSIQPAGAGGQAAVFLARRSDGRPAYESHAQVVVKLFDPRRNHAAAALRDEFDSLARLHATVDGLVIRGWTIRAPRPLFAAEDSLGVAMTVVPGITLSSLLVRTGRLDRKLFESLAPAVVEAMRVYWSAENRVYGDFHLRNVLCDPATRCLSLVDPGMPGPAWLCPDAPRLWFPASRDLAYLLYYTASAVKLTLGKPVLRRRERWLATRLLDVALNTLAAPEQRGALREEIRACAAAHAAQIRPARSLAGLWRSSVRRVTARYVARVLDSLGTASVEIPGAAHPLLPEEAHA